MARIGIVVGVDEALEEGAIEPAKPRLVSSHDLVLSEPIGVDKGALLRIASTAGGKRRLGNNNKLVVKCLEIESRASVRFIVILDRDERSKVSVGRLSAVVDASGIAEAV